MIEQLNKFVSEYLKQQVEENLQNAGIFAKLILKMADKISSDLWFLPNILTGIAIILFLGTFIYAYKYSRSYPTIRKVKKLTKKEIREKEAQLIRQIEEDLRKSTSSEQNQP